MIQVGDRVRSFDFPHSRDLEGERACYVEGYVHNIVSREGCKRYEIRVDRDVFGGVDSREKHRVGTVVYPPVNGTPKLFGGVCDNVELV